MGIFRQALGLEHRGADYQISPADLFERGIEFGSTGTAGERVSENSALGIPTVYRCVQIISDTLASQELGAHTKQGSVFIPAPEPDFLSLDQGPSRSKSVTLSTGVVSVLLTGNTYYSTLRDGQGKVLQLDTLNPKRIRPYRHGAEKRFEVDGMKQTAEGQPYTEFDILHIPGLVKPGELEGCSPLELFIETFSLNQAATKQAAAFFGNGNMPAGIFTVEGDMSPTAKSAARQAWDRMHKGAGNSGKIAVLTHGAKFERLTLSNNESQFLETRQFGVNEVARIYGVPTSLLAHTEGPEMGKSVEDKRSQFSEFTLGGWFNRFQDGFTWLAKSEGGDPAVRIRFDREDLERGNFTNFVASGVQLVREGVITINEFRSSIGKPPVPWGDEPISVQVQEVEEKDDDDE